jgi:hypothetical protein
VVEEAEQRALLVVRSAPSDAVGEPAPGANPRDAGIAIAHVTADRTALAPRPAAS